MSSATYERPSYASDFVLPGKLDAWLDAVVGHYASVGVPLPDRRYWTLGTPAYDCEQVVLAVQQTFLGTSAAPNDLVACNGPRGATFTLEIIRCAPALEQTRSGGVKIPSADLIESMSVDPVIDMEIMLDLAPYFDEHFAGVMVTINPISANGGLQGAQGTYTVSL